MWFLLAVIIFALLSESFTAAHAGSVALFYLMLRN